MEKVRSNGQCSVQSLYSYESTTARGHNVIVQPGERFALISDTNDQWWYVAKEGVLDDGFYMPKSYVMRTAADDAVSTFRAQSECSEPRQQQRAAGHLVHSEQLRLSSPAADAAKPAKNGHGAADANRRGFWLAPAGSRISRSIPVDLHLPPGMDSLSVAADSSDDALVDSAAGNCQWSSSSPPLTPNKPAVVARGSESARHADRRSGDERTSMPLDNGVCDDAVTYANVQCTSARVRPPVPHEDERPLRRLPHDWAEYKDYNSGRTYFYHCASGTATWKPPRRMIPPREVAAALGELPCDDVESSFSADEPNSRASFASGVASPAAVSSACANNVDEGSERRLADVSDGDVECGGGQHGTPPPPTTPPSLHYLYNSAARRPTDNSDSEPVAEQDATAAHTTLDTSTASSAGGLPAMTASLDSGIGGLRQAHGSVSLRNKSHGAKWPAAGGGNRSSALDTYACSRHVAALVSSAAIAAGGGRDASPPMRSLTRGGFQHASVSSCYQRAAKSGAMEKCKLAEAGKKIKRHWTSCFVYLTGAHLIFYKDEKSAEKRGQHYPLPLGVCDLRGAQLGWSDRERDRRHKHVFQLTLVDRTVYAFSALETQDVNSWYHAVRTIISKLPEPDQYPTPVLEAPASALSRASAANGRRSLVVSRTTSSSAVAQPAAGTGSLRAGKTAQRAANTTVAENGDDASTSALDASAKESRDSILEKLKRFFRTRPSLESLKQKGIYKPEPVFGGVLCEMCRRERSTVPKFLRIATAVIELRGLDADGIYRMSGNLSMVQKIRCQCDQDKYGLLRTETDIHVVTGALKLFFRELQDSLFPTAMTKDFVNAIKLQRQRDRVRVFTDLLARMPVVHRDTLQHLLRHLRTVSEHCGKNRMEMYNLAIVFGPTLFNSDGGAARIGAAGGGKAASKAAKGRPAASKAVQPGNNPTLAFNMIMQGQVVEYLLKEYDRFFPDPQPPQPPVDIT